ncbi:MAG: rane protein involved in aromatic hydrocarbon degradation [Bacteroidetes bacterium]|nr:rane protein involved in aromatic hydrocarbon degradation [Bacteroidota bacterium]
MQLKGRAMGKGIGSKAVAAAIAAVMIGVSAAPAQTPDVMLRLSEPGNIFSARALGMGNAYSTIGYDYSATRFNPATLAVLDSTTFSMSVNFIASPNDAAYRDAITPYTTTSTSLGQFGMTFPLNIGQSRSVIGLGFSQSKDFNRNTKFDSYTASSPSSLIQDLTAAGNPIIGSLGLNYQVIDPVTGQVTGTETVINGNVQQGGFVLESGNFVQISGAASFEMMPNVFVGVTATYNSGAYLADREFTETDADNAYDETVRTVPDDPTTADFQSMYLHDVRDIAVTGWDFKFGALYKFYNFISIGASFLIPTNHTVSEIAVLSGSSEFASGGRVVRGTNREAIYSVTPAYAATVGAAVNLWFLTATAEATFIDYTTMKFVRGFPLDEVGVRNKEVTEAYRRVLNLNGGAELRLPFTGLIARAGFQYRPSPYAGDESVNDRKGITLGFGINSGGRLAFDIAYGYSWWDEPYRGYGTTFAGVVQQLESHDVMTTIKLSF